MFNRAQSVHPQLSSPATTDDRRLFTRALVTDVYRWKRLIRRFSYSTEHHASRRDAPYAMLNQSRTLLLALTTVAGLLQRCRGWSDEDILLPPINSTNRFLANLEVDVRYLKRSVEESESSSGSSLQPVPQCNVSVHRLLPTSLVVRWDSSFGFQCDVFVYTTNNHGRAFFTAAFNRAISPVFIEHLGVTGGQQELRLCVGCGLSRYRRFGQARSRGGQQTGDPITFCCIDFSLDELKGDTSWRLNRKPIESTLVACFMTLVIIVWSVAALIWPVPIIAGFLPNGMEQRRPR
ncbi:transmembrane protein 158 [Hypomesus transpacificus]|uniref:transmembrane protein 158 n=1 Tax=Hypomesus transpacificus TaxID=137520 RepID=UPI001F07B7C6|nr:transmembrane protein 158 [Hypomesus transpacificus]